MDIVGELALRAVELTLPLARCSIRKNKPHIVGVVDKLPPEDMSMANLALPLISHLVAWTRERYPPPSSPLSMDKGEILSFFPTPHHLQQVGGHVPGVIGVGKLSLSLTSCGTLKSAPCISSGPLSRADSGEWGVGYR